MAGQFRYLIMKITNKKTASKQKKIFSISSAIIAVAALALFLLDLTFYGILSVGAVSLWYLYFLVADYQFIEYSDENNRITLRFYKAISIGKQEYSSIEFPKELLREFHLENSVFGKLTDLTLVVNTKRGVAEYPSVSLTAVPFEERLQIRESLTQVLNK